MPMAHNTVRWTLARLHRLPDDGNKYELVRGELFVTPAPTYAHESLATVLHAILAPYVTEHQLGAVWRPRAVIQIAGSETEADLMVRPTPAKLPTSWARAPLPILVVEILSDATRRRDQIKELYMNAGIPEYWIVDADERTIRVVRPRRDDVVTSATLAWHPAGPTEPLAIDVQAFFREALG